MTTKTRLYALADERRFIAGTTDVSDATVAFVQNDVVPLEVKLLELSGNGKLSATPTQLASGTFTCRCGLVTPHATAPTVIAQGNLLWNSTASAYAGTMSLSTIPVQDLLGSAPSVQTTFEVQWNDTNEVFTMQKAVTLYADGLKNIGAINMSANEYWNKAGVLTGIDTDTRDTVTSADTILSAIGKLEATKYRKSGGELTGPVMLPQGEGAYPAITGPVESIGWMFSGGDWLFTRGADGGADITMPTAGDNTFLSNGTIAAPDLRATELRANQLVAPGALLKYGSMSLSGNLNVNKVNAVGQVTAYSLRLNNTFVQSVSSYVLAGWMPILDLNGVTRYIQLYNIAF